MKTAVLICKVWIRKAVSPNTMIDTVFSKELMLNTVISWERREKPCKFSFTSTCDLGAGSLGPFVQLVACLCGITWPSYFTAIGCSFPTGGTEMIMLYKNRRNFRNSEFVRNPLICVWARFLLMSVGLRPHNCQVLTFVCKEEPALLLKG